MPLTDPAVRNLKALDKPYKKADGGGLFLLVNPSGAKWWRLKFRVHGREKLLSLGTYPETSLAHAREQREEARALLARGIDPGAHRKATKQDGAERRANSFEAIAHEWFAAHGPNSSAYIDPITLCCVNLLSGLPFTSLA